MTTTPRLWKSQTQVNTSDAPVPMSGGDAFQGDGQVAALADGGYVVVWHDNSRVHNPSGFAIIAQQYNSFGNKVGGEVEISQFDSENQVTPAITALPNGTVAIAYVDLIAGSALYVRIFGPGGAGRIDTIDIGFNHTSNPSITAFANGGYVITYTFGTGDDTDIVARVVSPTGVVGARFDIENETDNRDFSEVATLSNGNFVVTYTDEFADSPTDTNVSYGIFTPAGTPVVSGISTNGMFGLGLETDPDVAALRNGGFVIVWTDPDNSTNDIRATILSNANALVLDNILVNTSTAGNQNEASVAALADGGFLVTWEDDTANLVRGQRFDALGNMIGTEFTVKNEAAAGHSPEAAVLTDGRIAYAVGDRSSGDADVATAIFTVDTRNDFNANGLSDILWQNDNGAPAIWLMSGLTVQSNSSAGPFNPGPSWHVKDSGDFNGDGHADILWQNDDGTPAIWLMNGSNALSIGAAGSFNPGPDWQVKATGDFNGDGKSDILWQGSDGTPAIWLMNGLTVLSNSPAGSFNPGPDWQIKDTGDFNGDGKSDILWQHDGGTPAIWFMDGMNFLSGGAAGSFNPGSDWHVIA